MNALVQFNDLIQKTQKAGFDVPETLKNNVLSGKTKPQQAVQQMKNLVTFNDLLSKSSAAGRNVPYNIQQAVLNGKMSPKNAVAEMKRLMIAEADSAASGMNKEGKDASASFNSGVKAFRIQPVKI